MKQQALEVDYFATPPEAMNMGPSFNRGSGGEWLRRTVFFFVLVISFRLSGIKGVEAGGSAPVSKKCSKS